MNNEICEIINNNKRVIAQKAVSIQYKAQPSFWEKYGKEGWDISIRDAEYHLNFLVEALFWSDKTIFIDYIKWLKELFASLSFPPSVLEKTFECLFEAVKVYVNEDMLEELRDYIVSALDEIENTTDKNDKNIIEKGEMPLSDLAQKYIDALLNGNRRKAREIIFDAIENGVEIKNIYLNVFQLAQYQIGQMWLKQEISVAKEHYCTAATQSIIAQMYPYIFSEEKKDLHFVGACIGGELHEIGIRIVADFFEMDGWDTYYIGANTPVSAILQALKEEKVDVLGLSATIFLHLSKLAATIDKVKNSSEGKDVKIIVGGYPFNKRPELWKKVGADGFAKDAVEAVETANGLID